MAMLSLLCTQLKNNRSVCINNHRRRSAERRSRAEVMQCALRHLGRQDDGGDEESGQPKETRAEYLTSMPLTPCPRVVGVVHMMHLWHERAASVE